MTHRRLEALLGFVHQTLFEPVLLTAGMGEQDDLVGGEGLERVLDREERIGLARRALGQKRV